MVHSDSAVRSNGRGVDAAGRERVGGNHVAAALFRHTNEAFLAGVVQAIAEGDVVSLPHQPRLGRIVLSNG